MNLWDMLSHCQHSQKFDVYVGNAYDQNIPIGEGDADSLRHNGDEFFYHLMDEVDRYSVHPDGVLVVIVKDQDYGNTAEQQYGERTAKRWDKFDPQTRPWRHSTEIDDKHRL